jgi:beta-lactamase class A
MIRRDAKKIKIWWGIAGVMVGIVIGAAGYATIGPRTVESPNSALRLSDLSSTNTYKYIDPLLALKNPKPETPQEFKSLEADITSFIEKEKVKGNATAVSVYFRAVGHQGGITLNPEERYNPASLLKVPIMMAYYRLAEQNPKILADKLVYSGLDSEDNAQYFKPRVELTPNRAYTVEELIERMIRYSDNSAVKLLVSHLNSTNQAYAFNSLADDLGVPDTQFTDDFITIEAYMLFFRVLYNSTYLTRDMSEKAMEVLTQTDFDGGIVAGLGDKSIPVAHKFGEYTLLDDTKAAVKRELHDCGFIYLPGHTYNLCIMTKGKDFGALQNIIQGISSRVYATILKQG